MLQHAACGEGAILSKSQGPESGVRGATLFQKGVGPSDGCAGKMESNLAGL